MYRIHLFGALTLALCSFHCGGKSASTGNDTTPVPSHGDATQSPGSGDEDVAAGDAGLQGDSGALSAAIAWPADAALHAEFVGRSSARLVWPAAIDAVGASEYRLLQDGDGEMVLAGDVLTTTVTGLQPASSYQFSLTGHNALNEQTESLSVAIVTAALPPDPAEIAPEPEPADTHSLASTHMFLISGDDPTQDEVDVAAIDERLFAIVRGEVLSADNTPLPGVTVSIVGHPEYGHTLSRTDGKFDIVVNGGGTVCVDLSIEGYPSVQRTVELAWNSAVQIPAVILLEYSLRSTAVLLDNSVGDMQVAMGDVEVDADGTRQAVVLFPQDTAATMRLNDGSIEPLTQITVRATEYTVGDNGPAAMPAPLPATSAYTYAVELSVDEAVAAGATTVLFSSPVPFYVDNFLEFPAGTVVPVGYYDRELAQWVPSKNGVVLDIVGESTIDALLHADIDTDGDGLADDQSVLDGIQLTLVERQKLATLYEPGASLWRAQFDHFTPADLNWPVVPDSPEAAPPEGKPDAPKNEPLDDDPCDEDNSIIACQNQSLGHALRIPGTPFALHYESSRMPGDIRERYLSLPLLGSTVPSGAISASYSIAIAGQYVSGTLDATPNLSVGFVWDGTEGVSGKPVSGSVLAKVTMALSYPAIIASGSQQAEAFGSYPSGTRITAARTSVTLGRDYLETLTNNTDDRTRHLSGWTLDVHHALDPKTSTLRQGNGNTRNVNVLGRSVSSVIGKSPSVWDCAPPITPELKASEYYGAPNGILALGDGGLLISELCEPFKIVRLHPDGSVSIFAGGNSPQAEPQDDLNNVIRATDAVLSFPSSLAQGNDGSIYVRQTGDDSRVRRISAEGIITTVAGTGTPGFSGDGGLATEAQINNWGAMAVGPDGSVYLSEYNSGRIRKVSTQGIITTIAGGCGAACGGPLAIDTAVSRPNAMTVGADGSVYFASVRRISMIRTDGTLARVAGNGSCITTTMGALAATGCVYDVDTMTIDKAGLLYFRTYGPIIRISSAGHFELFGPDDNRVYAPDKISAGPDGSIYAAFTYGGVGPNIHKIGGPSMDTSMDPSQDDTLQVTSKSGHRYFLFDHTGRHLSTHDIFTGDTIYTFAYEQGLLKTVTGIHGDVLEIERDTSGTPTALLAEDGTRTELTSGSWLDQILYPDGTTYDFTYDGGGLMGTMTDGDDEVHAYAYDTIGRLTSDINANGKTVTLERRLADGGYVVTKTVGDLNDSTELMTDYAYRRLADGTEEYSTTDPKGLVMTLNKTSKGIRTLTYPDGSRLVTRRRSDPATGSSRPFLYQVQARSPSGKLSTTDYTQTFVGAEVGGIQTITSTTRTRNENGFISSITTDYANRTITRTSPEGRVSTTLFDANGSVVSFQADADISPTTAVYGTDGRLSVVDQGHNVLTYAWVESEGKIVITDALGRGTEHVLDAMGRIAETTLSSGSSWSFGYDARGRRNYFVAPNGTAHEVAYQARGRYEQFGAPGEAPLWQWSYGLDHAPLSKTWARRTMTFGYDGLQRLENIDYTEAQISHTYAASNEAIEQLVWTRKGSSESQTVDFVFDGNLMTGVEFSGDANGAFSVQYSNRLLPQQITATIGASQTSTAYAYDGSPNLVGQGPFTITRDGPAGLISGIDDGVVGGLAIDRTYDNVGRPQSQTLSVGASVYGLAFAYDAVGRMVTRTEDADGVTRNYAYTYDAEDQLIEVRRDGTLVEQYDYDINGNRVGDMSGAVGSYNSADWLTSFAGDAYVSDSDGFLVGRNEDAFLYGARGELLQVDLSAGETIAYTYDGLGRRTARADFTGVSQFMYADPAHLYLVSHALTPAGELHRYYYDDNGNLYAIDVAGSWFYVATNQVGSPRIIYDASGAVVRVIDRDHFGRILADSNPSWFLPVGYAGGLEDSATGLVRFVYRDYIVRAGRWSVQDPSLYSGNDMNLYRYASNDPVSRKDPLGLWCVGFSGYVGPGGGAKVCRDKNGQTVICTETGAGFGTGIDASLDDTNPRTDGTRAKASLGAGCGPVGSELEIVENGPCDYEVHWNSNAGIVKGDVNLTDLESSGVTASVTDGLLGSLLEGLSCGAGGKIAFEKCEVVPF